MLILLLNIAIFWSFALDDAWISFRYAQNWNNGLGLVYNPGERVEGYTNFLWTVIIGLLMRIGMDPLIAAKFSGILLSLLVLLITHRLYVRVSPGQSAFAVLPVLLLSTNVCFAAYAVAGMETPLFALLVVLGVYLFVRENESTAPIPFPLSGSIFALASLARPEGVLFFGMTVLYATVDAVITGKDNGCNTYFFSSSSTYSSTVRISPGGTPTMGTCCPTHSMPRWEQGWPNIKEG